MSTSYEHPHANIAANNSLAALQGVRARMTGGATSDAVARQAQRMARLFSLLMAPDGTPAATQAASELGAASAGGAAQMHAGDASPEPPRTPSPGGSCASAASLDTAFNPVADDGTAADAAPTRAHDAEGGENDDLMPGDAALDNEAYEVLYDDADLSLLPGEIWWDAAKPAPSRAAARPASAPAQEAEEERGVETDSEDSDASSEASLQPLDLEEPARAIDLDSKWRPVQLHHVLADLRQNEDTVKRVAALDKLEPLVRCALYGCRAECVYVHWVSCA